MSTGVGSAVLDKHACAGGCGSCSRRAAAGNHRTIWARLRREGVRASEKVVRRLMREEGLAVVYNRRRRRWSSYEGEVSAAPPNLVARTSRPRPRRAVGHRRHRVPHTAGKAYLSAVVDCYDGRPAGWRIGLPGPRPRSPTGRCSTPSRPGGRGAHRGAQRPRGHYRWPGWIAICSSTARARCRPRGAAPDNAACEGFFAGSRTSSSTTGTGRASRSREFSERLDAHRRYYRAGGSSARWGGS